MQFGVQNCILKKGVYFVNLPAVHIFRKIKRLALIPVLGFSCAYGVWAGPAVVPDDIHGNIQNKTADATTDLPDSVWVKAVNDSSIIIRPDSTGSEKIAEVIKVNKESRAEQVADSLMLSRDSIIRAQRLADSLKIAREDSLARIDENVYALVERGNDLTERYYFSKAYECFSEAERICADAELKSFITRRLEQCDYAQKHSSAIPQLTVAARALLGTDDFFLYYPLPDKSWRPVDGAPAVYCPKEDSITYFNHETESNVIYPMVQGDRMYFASKDLPGFGGYDIFCQDWDENLGEWGEPHNLGLPYNSPFDDFLFMTTEDGMYNIFSSTRGLGPDGEEVRIYVTVNDPAPEMRGVTSPKDLANISELNISSSDELKSALDKANAHRSMDLTEIPSPMKPQATPRDSLLAGYNRLLDREKSLAAQLDSDTSVDKSVIISEMERIDTEKRNLEESILNAVTPISTDIYNEGYGISPASVEGIFPFYKHSLGSKIKIRHSE